MDRSRPFIEVDVDGKTVSSAFYTRLSSATISDAPGQEADTCELVFDDQGNAIAVPEIRPASPGPGDASHRTVDEPGSRTDDPAGIRHR